MSKGWSLLVLLLLSPLASADASFAPAAVAVIEVGDADALVAWTTGTALADTYRIYGISAGGGRTLLGEVPPTESDAGSLLVEGGFTTYAVSGVLDGQESAPTYAARTECVTLEIDVVPPGVGVDPLCVLDVVGRTKSVVYRA